MLALQIFRYGLPTVVTSLDAGDPSLILVTLRTGAWSLLTHGTGGRLLVAPPCAIASRIEGLIPVRAHHPR